MPRVLIALALSFAFAVGVRAQQNLIPNFNFADPTPLKGWRVDFPYQDWYVKNAGYIKQVDMAGKRCALLDLPAGVPGNEGGKIETALVPCEPGATYRAEVECYLPELAAKLHAECFAVNPNPKTVAPPDPGAEKNPVTTVFRIPEGDGHPALVMVYRKQFPDPPGGAKWSKVETTFAVPFEWEINLGKDERNKSIYKKVQPAFMSIKAYTFGATPGPGKSYFTNFKLFKTKAADPGAAPQWGTVK